MVALPAGGVYGSGSALGVATLTAYALSSVGVMVRRPQIRELGRVSSRHPAGSKILDSDGSHRSVVVGAAALWLLSRDGDAGDGDAAFLPTVERLTQWLNDADACLSVKTDYSRLPVKPNGPPGAAFQQFGEAPIAAALVGYEALGGYIAYYRFPTRRALIGAVKRHPELTRHESICVSGDELLIDGILGHDPTLEFCKRLGFAIHRAPAPLL